MAGFRAAGVDCDEVLTNAPRHATAIARERAAAYDAIFTLGGDGTAMEVITALANGGPPVGILAGGTGNVLVRSLGIPIRPQFAVPQLLAGDEARIDLGELGDGRHFAIGVGVGLDEAMIAGASPYMKKRLGYLAYVWSAVRAGLRLERFRVRLTVDGETRELDASSVLIANIGSVLGGLIHLGEGIHYDDGVLHACVYAPRNVFEALRIFARMLRGTVQRDPRVLYMPGTRFRIETEPARRAQADGELLDMTPIDITVRPRAARVLIPKESLRK
jgi:diacylglycerol kinase (ATP)